MTSAETGTEHGTRDVHSVMRAIQGLPPIRRVLQTNDRFLLTVSDEWLVLLAPDDGADDSWAVDLLGAGDWTATFETWGSWVATHFTLP